MESDEKTNGLTPGGKVSPNASERQHDPFGPNGGTGRSEAVETNEPEIDWSEVSATAGGIHYDRHNAIYPPDSILEDYMEFVRAECEAADAFILGSILPICAAQLARRVRFPWGSSVKFPNIFSMLVGPPGDRKSSAIAIARQLAKKSLNASAFLPEISAPNRSLTSTTLKRTDVRTSSGYATTRISSSPTGAKLPTASASPPGS